MSARYACATCGEEYPEADIDTAAPICPFDKTRLARIGEELAPGTVLDNRFVIVEAVSGGAMGRIYKAHHKLMRRHVAIKTILPHLVASGAALKRFQQEAQALSALSHPNILSIFDFFIAEDGQPYLVMNYLEGTNLEKIRTDDGAMSPARAVHIFAQCCDGLAAAHERDIIHRDIKPSNIMLTKIGKDPDFVKIIDFGIAKLPPESGEPLEQLTATGDVFGTPQYMSPEQCRAQKPDARSDVYSLGCVMYASLTGKPPFSADDPMQCMLKHIEEKPAAFTADLGIPEALQAVVMKAMSKKPDDRFQSMDEMHDAILATGLAPQSATMTSTSLEPPTSAHKLSLKMTLGAAAAFAMISGAGLFLLVNHNQTKPTPRPSGYIEQQPKAQAPATGTTAQTAAPQSETATPPTTNPPSVSPTVTPAQQYSQSLAEGEKAYKLGDFDTAQRSFNEAHRIAEHFGDTDPRFLDSMEWQGKVAFRKGEYSLAKQAMQYVLYGLKSRGDKQSSRYKEAAKLLREIEASLKSR